MRIVFATNNQHKLEEIREILGDSFEVLSLRDIGCHEDIPETGDTLMMNAIQKADYIYQHYHINCFADDTGLEVDALNGEPGVHSARYAEGTDHDSEANMTKLLHKLEGIDERSARFKTVIALVKEEEGIETIRLFEGKVEGNITLQREGSEGFGYDPIFQPTGYYHTFAALGLDIKNHISHRARAVAKLADYLKNK